MSAAGRLSNARDIAAELADLGVGGAAYRAAWEVRARLGLFDRAPTVETQQSAVIAPPFTPAADARDAIRSLGTREDRARSIAVAEDSAHGRVLCFGRWTADFGMPIDWTRDPGSGYRWPADVHWTRAVPPDAPADVKLTWEVARFPQAYHLARAAVLDDAFAERARDALYRQIEGFVDANPFERGIHWASSQEVAVRVMAWLFALHVLGTPSALATKVTRALAEAAAHIDSYFEYSERAVRNNHLINEAVGLLLLSRCLPDTLSRDRRRRRALAILDEEATRQFYPDGAYLMASHNYHRVAAQAYLWAVGCMRADGERVPEAWLTALERSLVFLYEQQDPVTGQLPNYGTNDGALPAILSGCDFSDFRPLLQALSVTVRGERLYEVGPHDEEAIWWSGAKVLDLPRRDLARTTRSFLPSGYHVLRGDDERTFCVFRCGDVRTRFEQQMDVGHVDVWWRGINVLVDAGTYLYNGPPEWNAHFAASSAHNTVTVDGLEQMVHHRRFKLLYRPHARVLAGGGGRRWRMISGEHDAYVRRAGVTCRRSVLALGEGQWVIADRLDGEGEHRARLHWLGVPVDHAYDATTGTLTLRTLAGDLSIAVRDATGAPLAGDVVAGADRPPRGWRSRYYGEKVAAPSLAVSVSGKLPLTLVTLIAPAPASITVAGDRWEFASAAAGGTFRMRDGEIADVEVSTEVRA